MAVEASTAAKCKEQDLEFWQLMIAGSVAGSVKHMTMFPVRTMNQRMLDRSYSQRHVGVRQALRSVIQTEGSLALYRGIWSVRHGTMGPAHFLYFSSYEVSKKFLSADCRESKEFRGARDLRRLRSCMQLCRFNSRGYGKYRGVCDCVKRVIREEGISSFYTFYRRGIRMNSYSSALHFVTYEAAKRRLTEISHERKGWWLVHATAGATAGGLAVALTLWHFSVDAFRECSSMHLQQPSVGPLTRRPKLSFRTLMVIHPQPEKDGIDETTDLYIYRVLSFVYMICSLLITFWVFNSSDLFTSKIRTIDSFIWFA